MANLLQSALLVHLAALMQGSAAFSPSSPARVRLPFPSARVSIPHDVSKCVPEKDFHNIAPLLSAASNEGDDMSSKVKGRKSRVIVGYKAMTISYLTAGLFSFARAGGKLPLNSLT